jgi:hypothetical protein
MYAVIGVTGSGKRVGTVSADLADTGCAPLITNGVAFRYDWAPPPDLARRMLALTPTGVPASPNASPTK